MMSETQIKYPIPDIQMPSQPCWCGQTGGRVVSRRDRWNQPVVSVLCTACGTIRLEPRMTPEQATAFYTGRYDETHEPQQFFERQRSLQTDRYLRHYLKDLDSILDYGCGPGGKLLPLAEEGVAIYGTDLNPAFLDFAVSKGMKPWISDMRYDCIFLSHTLEHWIHPREDLRKLVETNLRPDGLVIIEVPLVDRLVLGQRRGGFGEETHLAHVWYFSTATLSALLATLSCELEFSDHVTTCVFRHRPGGARAGVSSSPLAERVRLAIIELNRNALLARITQRLNRTLQFVDTGFRQREIRRVAETHRVSEGSSPGV